ncbi:hypothetical protein VTL71DRAFT_4455 [Oculimacula yallundae]|uniref:Ankyrin repeat protein n=1 Tax=Oculimacula yallundae TaxID=86028 RepID=A0ABR4C3L6_9HELO
MGDHDTPATCLSSHEHGNDVRDTFLHYFGCLKEAEREVYFESLEPDEKERIEAEKTRIHAQRAYFEEDGETKLLVDRFKVSLAERIPRLRHGVVFDGVPTKPCKENSYGLNAYMVFFKNAEPFTNELYLGKFPNQRIAVKDLLHDDKGTNPLMQECGENEIRYFHLPGNNMDWIEEAIARYYNEPRPSYDGLFRRPETPGKAYMLLRPEFWRGQQHGGRHDAIHARHMRPRCDIISTDPDNLEESPKNLVLFMPYLHWETDRKRTKFDETMRNISEMHAEEEHERHQKRFEAKKRKAEANGTVATINTNGNASGSPPAFRPPRLPQLGSEFKMIYTTTEVFEEAMKHQIKTNPQSKFSKSKVAKLLTNKGLLAPTTSLGRILYRAALLSEAMDNYQEQELLKTYLYHDPPFHPRRTLDQSYYWTLKTTKKRDRDQVVYRGTAPEKEFMHSGTHEKSGCRHCERDIRKVPRVIMVDQLWLWILDGNTIITSFPKRYGRNKPDPSAVHKSIRLRLSVCRKGEINSAYDLALIILDQCSRVFFDRTKTADRQPQAMDLFASAIGDVTYKQTIAYDHFWATALQVSHIYKSKDPVDDAEDKAKSLLDINPEGKLLREIKDILDEIHIMTNIKKKQQRVFKQFRKHIEHIFAPQLSSAKELGTAKPKEVTESPEDLESPHIGIHRMNSIERNKQEKAAKWTLEFANELSADLDDRVTDLNNLRESAEHTEQALNGLLGLKQQQASVVQARKSVQQTDETLRQGRSILLFTIITIIFLPLSFGATFFGMNANEFEDGKWTVRQEIIYIIPISCGIILTCFILAFSSFTRSILLLMVSISWTWFVTRTHLYSLWEHFKIDSLHLTKMRKDTANKWKEAARKESFARREARQKIEDEKAHKIMRDEEEKKKKKDATVPPGAV